MEISRKGEERSTCKRSQHSNHSPGVMRRGIQVDREVMVQCGEVELTLDKKGIYVRKGVDLMKRVQLHIQELIE